MKNTKSCFSNIEKEMYKGDILYFVNKLPNKKVKYTKSSAVIKANYNLIVDKLSISELNEEQNKLLQKEFQKFVYSIFSELEFFNPDNYELTLKDYIEYILKNKTT